VLFYFEKFKIKVNQSNKSKYEDAIQIYDAISVVELKEKNQTTIPTFDEYLERVLNEFGIYSREHIIVKIYQQVKCRDDLLLIVANDSTPLDKLTNYLVVGEIFRVVLNDYKTIDRYGVVDIELDTELTNLLSHYMENNNIQVGDSLFNSNNISKIVSRINQKLGYVGWGAINLIRKMLASDTSVLPIEEQVKVARQMCHSLKVTNSNYVVKE
jgi:imidazoleglycerol phosphate dehydratase HisB